jgi:uncharacterized surface protein with fasciclin (FAS1) repeats
MSTNDRTTVDTGTGVDASLRTADIIDTAAQMAEISRFLEAVRAAGLEVELRTPEFKTLFAPSNQAMEGKLPRGAAELASLIGRHIVLGRQTEADLRTASELRTLSGDPLRVEYRPEGSLVGGARIIRHDVPCQNGQIHVLDRLVS